MSKKKRIPQSTRKGRLKPVKTRPIEELIALRDQYGSPLAAAMAGEINHDEYLRLEKLNEH
jgi:hypothetical protein